jgi:erythromycin esterase
MLSRRFFLASAAAFTVAGTGKACTGKAWGAAESPIGFGPTPFLNGPLDPETRASRIAWLHEHAAPLRSIDIADDDFADLDAFGKAVGDSRIVMLGEQTHGDGTTFLAKARLIRFLHQRMGFDVLAFESGLYEMSKVWQRIRNGEAARTAVRRGLFGIWSQSEQVQPLFDYVGERARSSRPLELAGFDCQATGSATRDRVIDDLSLFLAMHGIDPASIAGWTRFRVLLDKVTDTRNLGDWKPSKEERDVVLSVIDTLSERLAATEGADIAFWRQVLKSAKVLTQLRMLDLKDWPAFREYFNQRDAGMADNLIWLAREAYPGRKIIVWAATFHNIRHPEVTVPDGRTTMGRHVWQALGDTLFNVAFTGYAGLRGVASREPTELAPPPADSLEGLWGATNQQNGFLDLRRLPPGGEWLDVPFPSRLLSENSEAATAPWRQFLDAVVFLRGMRPSTLAE